MAPRVKLLSIVVVALTAGQIELAPAPLELLTTGVQKRRSPFACINDDRQAAR